MAEIDYELSKKFQKHVSERLGQIGVPEETRADISEYIVMLMTNGKQPQEIIEELNSFSGESINVETIQSFFNDFRLLINPEAAIPEPQTSSLPAAPSAFPSQSAFSQGSKFSSMNKNIDYNNYNSNNNNNNNINNGRFQRNTRFAASNGIRKNQNNFGGRNQLNVAGNPVQLQQALADLLAGKDPNKKKTRCRNFPHCQFKDCMYAHPTKICFQFPNCPNAPGTCNFLHPGEDDALMAEYEKVKLEHQQQKLENQQKLEQQNGIGICHKGSNCYNPHCKYAHPTKANESNEITIFEWCQEDGNCNNVDCHKAHHSYKSKDEVRPTGNYNGLRKFGVQNNLAKLASAIGMEPEKSLDACKFGARCMNPRCKFRHASTSVLCRDGSGCTRIDCYFTHPINQDCKYSVNCKNKNCIYKHPPGRDEMINKPLVWTASGNNDNNSTDKTTNRQFAVDDKEVLEKAPPQEDTSMAV